MSQRHKAASDNERRDFSCAITLRDDGDSRTGTISGVAAVFAQETVIGGSLFGFREKIDERAFNSSLERSDDVRALFNHDPNVLLGRTSSQTLRLAITRAGLQYDVDLPDTSAARDVRELIRRGDITGSSFGFKVLDDVWDESEVKTGKLPLRTITDVELYDVSPVVFPAYPETSVSARAKAESLSAAEVISGVVPRNISVAVSLAEWRELSIEDFTEDRWVELTDRERRRIARHYAWSPTATPEAFEDLQLGHHAPSDGTAVRAAVVDCLARLHEADIPSADLEKVRSHLQAHLDASDQVVAIEARDEFRRQIDEALTWKG